MSAFVSFLVANNLVELMRESIELLLDIVGQICSNSTRENLMKIIPLV